MIENALQLLDDPRLELNLILIKVIAFYNLNYRNLPKYMKALETSGLSMIEAMTLLPKYEIRWE